MVRKSENHNDKELIVAFICHRGNLSVACAPEGMFNEGESKYRKMIN